VLGISARAFFAFFHRRASLPGLLPQQVVPEPE